MTPTGHPNKSASDATHPHEGVVKEIDWEDFRDHLGTAHKDGSRRWLHPKKPSGFWHRQRSRVSWLLLAIMFTGPFIKINGNPLLLFNIVERRFSILGQLFWPADSIIFAAAMLLFITSIFVFTSSFGRLWCGWTCPQTLLMEMVFRKLEYWIEGDGPAQRALAAAAWNARKIRLKLFKHAIFFGLSFLIGNTLLSYIIGIEKLMEIVTDNPANHVTGLAFMLAFTALFYLIFARFREQACTFICPYGRFQSTVVDENTMVVAYDHKRGEKRGPLHRGQAPEARAAEGLGDCVNCHQCVAVCPTGIDIRNGTQMECVNCAACIDACDQIMDKVGKPRGLVRYASLNSIERGEPFRFTRRMGLYTFILCALAGLLAFLVFTRSDVEAILLRAPGALYQQAADGKVSNLYTVKILNKTSHDIPVELRVEEGAATLRVMGLGHIDVPSQKLAQTSVLIDMDPSVLAGPRTKLVIGVYSKGKLLETVKTVFVGPRS